MKKNEVSPGLRVLIYIVLVMVAIIQIYPVAWVIMSSFKDPTELAKSSVAFPTYLYLGNYIRVFTSSNISRAYINSCIVAVLTLALDVLISCPFAYALCKLQWKSGPVIFNIILLGMMLPNFICLIPMFWTLTRLGLRNSYISLILPQVGFGLPLSIYMYRSFMDYLPDSLLEAADIDGATALQKYIRIVMPMVKNATITILTFKFIYVWNEFTYANTFISKREMKTLPITLKDFVSEFGLVDWGPTYAAIVLVILPALIIYFFLSKNVIEGMALGAIKS